MHGAALVLDWPSKDRCPDRRVLRDPRRDLAAVGGFDEGYVNGCEDVDLCLRSRAAGFSCHVALHSVVKHHISQSAGRKLRDEQNTARLVERWADTIAALAAPAWSRWQISTHAQHSHRFDYPLVCAALAHVLLRGRPPRLVRTGVAAAMQQERQRWHALLNGIPAPSKPSPAAPIQGESVRSTERTTDCGRPFTVRNIRPRYSPIRPSITSCVPEKIRSAPISEPQP